MTLSMNDMVELQKCSDSLEVVLLTLDSVGAGIAAIHVDAAITQLRGNIDLAIEQSASKFDPSLIYICEEYKKSA